MTGPVWALPALAAAGVGFGVWQWAARRRLLGRLNKLLDEAMAGYFSEEHYDETALSALESKLARLLRGAAAGKKAAEGERQAVQTLIADISHQTRTPVANLLLYAGLLAEGELAPEQRLQAQAVVEQGQKLSFLIQTLVKASRLEAGIIAPRPAQNAVAPLLEAAAQAQAPAAQAKGIALSVVPTAAQAAFDRRWTGETLGNLVDNAVKYTPPGGAVTLSAQMLDSFCRIDVADTGPGIPEEDQGAVFDRFYRSAATSAAEGLGLGLYLARQIVTAQGGYIKLTSRPGAGCVFSVYLPREVGR